jgi:hypothetical protein
MPLMCVGLPFVAQNTGALSKDDHLRHAKFAGLRDDKDARSVLKEN